MKTICKFLALAALALSAVACTRPYAIYTIQGTPQAIPMRDSKTVATRIDPKASALTQRYESIVISELKKPTSHFHYNPKNPDLLLHIATSRDDAKVVGMTTRWAPFVGARSHNEEVDEITVVLSLTTKDGRVLWDGSMRGDGTWLAGKKAAACTRVLFDYFDHNESGEESCFWSD